MAEPLILVVSLWIDASQEEAFVAYEREAARVMARHGGQIQRVIRVHPADAQIDPPFEIHISVSRTKSPFSGTNPIPKGKDYPRFARRSFGERPSIEAEISRSNSALHLSSTRIPPPASASRWTTPTPLRVPDPDR